MLKYELRLEIDKGRYKRFRSNNLDRVLDKTIESIKNEWTGVRVLSSEIWADVSINLDCEYNGSRIDISIEFDSFNNYSLVSISKFRDQLVEGING